VPEQRVDDGALAQVPRADVVVDAARVQLVAGLGQRDGRDGELGCDEVDGGLLPAVPELAG
jgi:hypothetical protein